VVQAFQAGGFGKLLEIHSCFWHASDLDPSKPVNWKRQVRTCGEIGVMGDLGMHVVHVPFRLGLKPTRVFAQLQKIYTQRPDGKGGMAECDTWDNAMLHCDVAYDGRDVPMRLEMKRLAPGATNTWWVEFLGTDGGVRYSTAEPKTLVDFRASKGAAAGCGWTWASRLPFTDNYRAEFSNPAFPIVSCRCGRRYAGGVGWRARWKIRMRHARRGGGESRGVCRPRWNRTAPARRSRFDRGRIATRCDQRCVGCRAAPPQRRWFEWRNSSVHSEETSQIPGSHA
jgi:hypothetical protein